jgi:uncharacterized protein (DUF1684 family)
MKTFRTNRELALTVFLLPLLIAAGALSSGCSKPSKGGDTAIAEDTSDVYVQEVKLDRKRNELHFLKDESSPLKASDRDNFPGLAYYPVSRSWAFYTALVQLAKPEEVTISTSKNKPRTMLFIGHLPFKYEGKEYRLRVFAPKDTADGNYWFVPFRDATTGTETYAGGRFIEIESIKADSVYLDFNYAFNPYCAYNDKFDCPIPPAENTLPFAVKAGEKRYPGGH